MNSRSALSTINNLKSALSKPGVPKSLKDEVANNRLLKSFDKLKSDPRHEKILNVLAPRVQTQAMSYMMRARKPKTSSKALSMAGLFDSSDDPSNDQANGTEVLQSYYNAASQYPGFQYSDFASFQAAAEAVIPGYTANIGSLVRMNSASTTVSDADARVADLANQSQGAATWPQIIQAAGGSGDTINWYQAVPQVAAATAATAASVASTVAQSVGTGVLGTLNLAKYLPWLVVGGGAIYIFTKAGGIEQIKKYREDKNPRRRKSRKKRRK